MKTILSMMVSVAAISAFAVSVASASKAHTIVPTIHVQADAPVSTIDLGANVLEATPRKPSQPRTALASNAAHAKHYVCHAPRGLASDVAATVRTCEWM